MVTTDDRKRDAFDRVAAASLKLLDLDRRPVPRDQHPKHHGCVRAKFVIAEGLEPPYRKGLFQHERVYDAWIRFSNGRQRLTGRGMCMAWPSRSWASRGRRPCRTRRTA
jgi:hypothetical protein